MKAYTNCHKTKVEVQIGPSVMYQWWCHTHGGRAKDCPRAEDAR